jgi:hypothetical protein
MCDDKFVSTSHPRIKGDVGLPRADPETDTRRRLFNCLAVPSATCCRLKFRFGLCWCDHRSPIHQSTQQVEPESCSRCDSQGGQNPARHPCRNGLEQQWCRDLLWPADWQLQRGQGFAQRFVLLVWIRFIRSWCLDHNGLCRRHHHGSNAAVLVQLGADPDRIDVQENRQGKRHPGGTLLCFTAKF